MCLCYLITHLRSIIYLLLALWYLIWVKSIRLCRFAELKYLVLLAKLVLGRLYCTIINKSLSAFLLSKHVCKRDIINLQFKIFTILHNVQCVSPLCKRVNVSALKALLLMNQCAIFVYPLTTANLWREQLDDDSLASKLEAPLVVLLWLLYESANILLFKRNRFH